MITGSVGRPEDFSFKTVKTALDGLHLLFGQGIFKFILPEISPMAIDDSGAEFKGRGSQNQKNQEEDVRSIPAPPPGLSSGLL